MTDKALAGELEQLREAATFLMFAARPEDCLKAMKALAGHLDEHWDTILAALSPPASETGDAVERVAFCNMALRSAVFDVLRRHDVSEQCFAEIAAITHAAIAATPADGAVALLREARETRECDICHAVVAASDEAMCCHCREVPWRTRSSIDAALNNGGA